MQLRCKDCEKYWNFGKDEENGVCSLPEYYFPTKAENPCFYMSPTPFTCSDCGHFGNDDACLTCKEDDETCGAFYEKIEDEILSTLFRWYVNGENPRERLNKLCDLFERSSEYRFIEQHRKGGSEQ